MVITGLDTFNKDVFPSVSGKRVGIVCHSPSTDRAFNHITELIFNCDDTLLSAIFGPQHGIFGQTQDNMIEWESYNHPVYSVPVYSLYGRTRKPGADMLKDTDILIVDLQDVGTRPYTYAWTLKKCMEAGSELNIPILIIDRPNPLGGIKRDGALLKRDYYTFVGGAEIPLCHGMTMGEIALWINDKENINCKLSIVRMKGWNRNMKWTDTGLHWIMPSPNMPTYCTSLVYPGMVLAEALNISEGRGTTKPFELCGAPFLETGIIIKELNNMRIPGCAFRQHNFIPTFNKYVDEYCHGIQIHITDLSQYEPVYTAACIFKKIHDITGKLTFNGPPYEYEEKLVPFDILSGDSSLREVIITGGSLNQERERWRDEIHKFEKEVKNFLLY